MPIPRYIPDLDREVARMATAARVRVGYEGEWHRTGGSVIGGSSTLDGPMGQMFLREIEGCFSPGPRPFEVIADDGTPSTAGYPLRWAQIAAMADLASNPLQDADRQLSLLYQDGIPVSGDVVSPGWAYLAAHGDIDRTMLRKQSLEIGLGSIAVRPTLEPYADGQFYPPALTVVYPDQAIAIRDPGNPSQACVFIEFDTSPVRQNGYAHTRGLRQTRGVRVWDVSDPSWPRFGHWPSPEAWARGYVADWLMEGAAYPYWWQGRAIMPVVCSQWSPSTIELLPASASDLQAMLDLQRQRAWNNVVGHAGSFAKALMISQFELKGMLQSMIDPTVMSNLWGDASAKIETIPDSTAAVERLDARLAARYEEWAQRYSTGLRAKQTESARSGVAIQLELTGAYLLRQRMVTRARPVDTAILQALIATSNYLIRSRQMSMQTYGAELRWTPYLPATGLLEHMIPEGSIEIGYPHHWSDVERKQIRDELKDAVDRGQESPRALYLVDHDLEDDRPDGPNWAMADEMIRSSLADASAYAALGYGQRWETRLMSAQATVEDEAQLYDVPPEVAAVAANGLRLRSETRLGPNGMTAYGKELLRRARKLEAYSPFLIGEVARLKSWLEAHQLDADAEGTAPTSEGVTWLTQGGQPALEWTRGIIAGVGQVATPAPEQQTEAA